jgi:quercetin 2,3-dioxygenase
LAALNGKITVGDSNATHDPFHTLVLSAASQAIGVSVTAVEGNTDFVLL